MATLITYIRFDRRNASNSGRGMGLFCKFFLALGLLFTLAGCKQPIPLQESQDSDDGSFVICSFNIQFLGSRKLRDNEALAQLLAENNCAAVVIQELVAPPDVRELRASQYYGQAEMPVYPGTEKKWDPSPVAHDFFKQMEAVGFDSFIMSPDKTGPNERDTTNSTAAEWFVTFYRSDILQPALDLPIGYIHDNLVKNENYERVPFAFSFRNKKKNFDFVLISVHLNPGGGSKDAKRRAEEFTTMFEWIAEQKRNGNERDFLILGDTNIENAAETLAIEALAAQMGVDMKSLNIGGAHMTNTNMRVGGERPYDHVFLNTTDTSEIKFENNFEVVNLVEKMQKWWRDALDTYPGNPYNHTLFVQYYSDHHPVKVLATPVGRDDD